MSAAIPCGMPPGCEYSPACSRASPLLRYGEDQSVSIRLPVRGQARSYAVRGDQSLPVYPEIIGARIKKGPGLPGSPFVLLSSTGNFPVQTIRSCFLSLFAFTTTCNTYQAHQARTKQPNSCPDLQCYAGFHTGYSRSSCRLYIWH